MKHPLGDRLVDRTRGLAEVLGCFSEIARLDRFPHASNESANPGAYGLIAVAELQALPVALLRRDVFDHGHRLCSKPASGRQ